MALKVSNDGILHLQEVEGVRLSAYDDKNPNKKITSVGQVTGTLTIGYGHTKTVYVGMKITQKEALKLFQRDLSYFEDKVNKMVTSPITQNMFNALVSFCYNVGENGFRHSTPLRLTNEKQYEAAAESLSLWNIPKTILGRRSKETALYLEGKGILTYQFTNKKRSWGITPVFLLVALIAI